MVYSYALVVALCSFAAGWYRCPARYVRFGALDLVALGAVVQRQVAAAVTLWVFGAIVLVAWDWIARRRQGGTPGV
jgi:hypothetical protein